MALVVLRTFSSLSEAQVASAALRAAGLHPVLLDEAAPPPYAGMASMGGVRLAVPEVDANDAVVILREALVRPVPAAHDDGEASEATGWEPPGDVSIADLLRDGAAELRAAQAGMTPGKLAILAAAVLLAGLAAWALRRAMGL